MVETVSDYLAARVFYVPVNLMLGDPAEVLDHWTIAKAPDFSNN